MSILFTAFTLGLLGSFHCVGMCGPLLLAVPNLTHNPRLTINILLYNAGRLLTYSLMGALFGALGQGAVVIGLQRTLTITIGIIMVLTVLLPGIGKWGQSSIPGVTWAITRIKVGMQQWLGVKTYLARFVLGSLNGWLPCGLVYLGIAGAMATGNTLEGSLYMLIFGLGTFPAMTAIGLFGGKISVPVRNRIRKTIPVAIVVMGAFFILRGLSLDIPFLSPAFAPTSAADGITLCR